MIDYLKKFFSWRVLGKKPREPEEVLESCLKVVKSAGYSSSKIHVKTGDIDISTDIILNSSERKTERKQGLLRDIKQVPFNNQFRDPSGFGAWNDEGNY